MVTLDVTLTMTPCPCLRICGMMARQAVITPNVFVSKSSRTVLSGVLSTTEPSPMPALFTQTSIAPWAATPVAIAFLMLRSSVTSSGSTVRRSEPAANTSGWGRRIVAMTFHPCCRKRLAVALP